ncbi:MAG: hypothetical protein M1816_000372 [Peltula sp. TS41687]|nr:MAG: hypothetical protein M1816_000372 [Peltula sp. TS41687]
MGFQRWLRLFEQAQKAKMSLGHHHAPDEILQIEDVNVEPPWFPKGHRLIIVNHRNILSWDIGGIHELFRSNSEGILAAKSVYREGHHFLAVADTEVIILHDIRVRMDEHSSYRLKQAQADNTVQGYCLNSSRLFDPGLQPHPSLLTCIAISPPGHLLITASAVPPVVRIQNLRIHDAPLILKPSASDAAVIVAAFHPEQPTAFALGFADGTIAMYDARRLFQNGGFGERRDGPASTGIGGELGYLRNVHDGGGSGITALDFLPGFPARLITAGLDGRCVILDFSTVVKMQGRIVKRWHVQGAVTCMAVLPHRPAMADVHGEKEYLIATGREHGEVLLQTSSGVLLAERLFDHGKYPILDLEWTTQPQSGDSRRASQLLSQHKVSRLSTRTNITNAQRPKLFGRSQSGTKFTLKRYPPQSQPQRRRRAGKSSSTTASILGKERRTREEIIEYAGAEKDRHDESNGNETFITAQTSLFPTGQQSPAQPTRPPKPPLPIKTNTHTNDTPQFLLKSPHQQTSDKHQTPTTTKSQRHSRQKSMVEIDIDRGVDINDLIPPRTSSPTRPPAPPLRPPPPTLTINTNTETTPFQLDSPHRRPSTRSQRRSRQKSIVEIDLDRGVDINDLIPPRTSSTTTASGSGSGETSRRGSKDTNAATVNIGVDRTTTAAAARARRGTGKTTTGEPSTGGGGNGNAVGDTDDGHRLHVLEARLSAVEKKLASLPSSAS